MIYKADGHRYGHFEAFFSVTFWPLHSPLLHIARRSNSVSDNPSMKYHDVPASVCGIGDMPDPDNIHK
jgi:hypothetical protein